MQSFITLVRRNWQSGVTIGLLSIPFSVSLAIASQTSPVAGIITAIWAGLVGALAGGSHFNIIGVTGALSGLLATYALLNGPSTLPMLALITGLFILIAAFFRLERYLVFVPSSTIHGFTLGIACIISLSQLNAALGISGLPTHTHLLENVAETLMHLNLITMPIFLVFFVFLIALLGLTYLKPRIPWVIVITPFGILLGFLSQHNYIQSLPTLGTKFGTICPALTQSPSFFWDLSLISTGLVVALVAIVETMISARIADGLTRTRHNKQKEMIGLGLANIVSGLCGGIPATAAIGRTILNIKTGATHRISGIIACITIACISFMLLPYFTFIPLAVIAAILVFTSFRLIEGEHFVRLFHVDTTNFFIALIVGAITVYADPIIGILTGAALSLLVFMYSLSKGYHAVISHEKKGALPHSLAGVSLYTIKGELAYINSQAHISRIETEMLIRDTIMLDLNEIHFIDIDGVDALSEIIMLVHNQQKKIVLINSNPIITPLLEQSAEYKKLKRNALVVPSLSALTNT